MSFNRSMFPESFEKGEELTLSLVGIGFRIWGGRRKNPNIEDTLIAASLEGLSGEGRVMSLLVDWLEIHHQRINADRLVQLVFYVAGTNDKKFVCFWIAIAEWLATDIRFAKLRAAAPKKRLDYLDERTDFLIQKNGEDERFEKTCLRVPRKTFRHRPEDILSPEELVRIHLSYRFRIMMGPTYRADMWAVLYEHAATSAAKLARLCYGSYPTAHSVKNDFSLVMNQAGIKMHVTVNAA